MKFLIKLFNYLTDLAEVIYEYRKKEGYRSFWPIPNNLIL